MDTIQLKFILKLLGFENYRASISKIKPNSKTPALKRDDICRQLCDFGYVDRSEEIIQLTIAPPGKSLLKIEPENLPISDTELKVLQASAKGTITPGQIKTVPSTARQVAIQSLVDRGFIKAVKTKIKEVWLTEQGKEYLRDEYHPNGNSPVYTGEMLNNYVKFLRKSLEGEVRPTQPQPTPDPSPVQSTTSEVTPTGQLSDAEVLEAIRELDRELNTDNYLPIFQLREKLQPPLSREEFDQTLYRLRRNDKIQLSYLQEGAHYSAEQINAGLPQKFGNPLFFIIVN